MAILLNRNAEPSACGIAFLDSFKKGNTFGVVDKSCALGQLSFGHEIAHLYGCYHNRESLSRPNPHYPIGHGFLMRPPVRSGLRTILA